MVKGTKFLSLTALSGDKLFESRKKVLDRAVQVAQCLKIPLLFLIFILFSAHERVRCP